MIKKEKTISNIQNKTFKIDEWSFFLKKDIPSLLLFNGAIDIDIV